MNVLPTAKSADMEINGTNDARAARDADVRAVAHAYVEKLAAEPASREAGAEADAVRRTLCTALNQLAFGIFRDRCGEPQSLRATSVAMLVIGGANRQVAAPWFAAYENFQGSPLRPFQPEATTEVNQDAVVLFESLRTEVIRLFPETGEHFAPMNPVLAADECRAASRAIEAER